DWPVRDLEGRLPLPASLLELPHGVGKVVDPIDEDRLLALEMTRQQDAGRVVRQFDHRHPRAHPLDGEDEASAEDRGEVAHIAGDVAARHVDEIEPLERHTASVSGPKRSIT